jgi:hypothetical protein
LEEVVLPAARLIAVEFRARTLAETLPLFVMVPVAFKVKVELVLGSAAIVASAATLKLPMTSIVTFAVESAFDIALAVELVMTISSGSNNQCPVRPLAADTSTTMARPKSNVPAELVST